MNEILLDAFRHSAWAKKRLITACASLSADELERPVPGSIGSIRTTLNHLVIADARYIARIDGGPPPWLDEEAANDLYRNLSVLKVWPLFRKIHLWP